MPDSFQTDTDTSIKWPPSDDSNPGQYLYNALYNHSVVLDIFNDTDCDLDRVTCTDENAAWLEETDDHRNAWPAEKLLAHSVTICACECPTWKLDIEGVVGYALEGNGDEVLRVYFKNPKVGDNELSATIEGDYKAQGFEVGRTDDDGGRNNIRFGIWLTKPR